MNRDRWLDDGGSLQLRLASGSVAIRIGVVLMLVGFGIASPLTADESSAKEPTIDDFAWIVGHWRGTGMGGEFEETWNPPLGGTMMGMFKMIEDGQVSFYELCCIAKVDDKFVLKVKHFDKGFVAWEEKAEFTEFPFKEMRTGSLVFNGIRFDKQSDDKMKIVVRVGKEDSQEIVFQCQRVKPPQK